MNFRRDVANFVRDDRGIILPLTLIVFVLGVVLTSALANATNTQARATQKLDATIEDYYSIEMAVQQLLWRTEWDSTFWNTCRSRVSQGNIGHGAFTGCASWTPSSITTSAGDTFTVAASQYSDVWRFTLTWSGGSEAAKIFVRCINASDGTTIVSRMLSWQPT